VTSERTKAFACDADREDVRASGVRLIPRGKATSSRAL
jgi:hypothetical protein